MGLVIFFDVLNRTFSKKLCFKTDHAQNKSCRIVPQNLYMIIDYSIYQIEFIKIQAESIMYYDIINLDKIPKI